MKIGIIGAGFVGRTLATLAVAQGHSVMLSNSRAPRTLFSTGVLLRCATGTAAEAAAFGDLVVIAVPFGAVGALPAEALTGKRVLDAVNYYPARDGLVDELERGRTTTSQWLARHLPGARITKAFNAIPMPELEREGQPAGSPERRALPLAGDHEDDKQAVIALYDAFGFDAVDAGGLAEGWRFERTMPAYCVRLTRTELVAALAAAQRPVRA